MPDPEQASHCAYACDANAKHSVHALPEHDEEATGHDAKYSADEVSAWLLAKQLLARRRQADVTVHELIQATDAFDARRLAGKTVADVDGATRTQTLVA